MFLVVLSCTLQFAVCANKFKSMFQAATHSKMGWLFGNDPSSRHWNLSRANYHFNQSIHCLVDDDGKAAVYNTYGQWLMERHHQCANTECTETASRRCRSCKNVHYCCERCQAMDWPRHRVQCDSAFNQKQANYQLATRLFEEAMRLELQCGFTNIVREQGWGDNEGIRQNVGSSRQNRSKCYLEYNCEGSNNYVYSRNAVSLAELLTEGT